MNGEWVIAAALGAVTLSGWVGYFRLRDLLNTERSVRVRERADAARQVEHWRMRYEDCQSTNIVLSTKIIKMRGHRD